MDRLDKVKSVKKKDYNSGSNSNSDSDSKVDFAISLKDFKIQAILGEGAFGKVF